MQKWLGNTVYWSAWRLPCTYRRHAQGTGLKSITQQNTQISLVLLYLILHPGLLCCMKQEAVAHLESLALAALSNVALDLAPLYNLESLQQVLTE